MFVIICDFLFSKLDDAFIGTLKLRDGIYHAYYCDEQGSTAYMTGPDGGVENSYRYDAFANLLERKETVPNRILYTGQQYDPSGHDSAAVTKKAEEPDLPVGVNTVEKIWC